MFFDIVGENLKKITIFVDFRTAKAAGAAQRRLTDRPLTNWCKTHANSRHSASKFGR